MKIDKVCPMCGETFQARSNRALYCSRRCRGRADYAHVKTHHAGLEDIINDVTEPFTNHSNLTENVTASRNAGLSYGYYMARKAGRI